MEVHRPGQPQRPRAIRGSRRWTATAICPRWCAGTSWCTTASMHELRAGRLPVLLGGDHCLGIGSISAVARHCREQGKKLRVLWLDAHADFNTSELSPSGNVHGMPVACLCGFGPRGADRASAERCRRSSPPGCARSASAVSMTGEKRFVHEQGLEVFDMRYIDEIGMRQTMEQALAGRGCRHAPARELRCRLPGS